MGSNVALRPKKIDIEADAQWHGYEDEQSEAESEAESAVGSKGRLNHLDLARLSGRAGAGCGVVDVEEASRSTRPTEAIGASTSAHRDAPQGVWLALGASRVSHVPSA